MRGGLLQKPTSSVMEAKKSHDLLSADWRPRRAGDVAPSESGSLRTRGAVGVRSSPSPKARESGALRSKL